MLGLSPTTAPGFSTKAQILERYDAVSDLDVSGIGYYQAFGYWKLACILQGVYARYVAGAGAGDQGSVDGFPVQIGRLFEMAADGAGGHAVSPEGGGGGLTEIFEVHQEPALREPILVVALEGWVDAGLGATTAIVDAARPGSHRAHRHLQRRALPRPAGPAPGGAHRQRDHDRAELAPHRRAARHGRIGRDMLFLVGPEPDFHWRAFTDAVVGLARSWRVRMVVGLGAFPAPAPHTRPVKLAATAPSESANLIEQVGIVQGELEVPAGVQAALEMAFGANGTPAVSLWARVPHYVAGMPFPEASAALIEGLAAVGSLSLDSSALRRAGDSSRRQVDQLIADNAEHQAMVRKLEENIDASEGNAMGVDAVPSGDEIAAELERFLRGEEQ